MDANKISETSSQSSSEPSLEPSSERLEDEMRQALETSLESMTSIINDHPRIINELLRENAQLRDRVTTLERELGNLRRFFRRGAVGPDLGIIKEEKEEN